MGKKTLEKLSDTEQFIRIEAAAVSFHGSSCFKCGLPIEEHSKAFGHEYVDGWMEVGPIAIINLCARIRELEN